MTRGDLKINHFSMYSKRIEIVKSSLLSILLENPAMQLRPAEFQNAEDFEIFCPGPQRAKGVTTSS